MRLAHVSLFGPDAGQCTGIINKLERNARAAEAEGVAIDFHAVMMGSNLPRNLGDYRSVRIQVVPGRNPVAVRIRQCRLLRELLGRYHRIVLRYPSVDPVCLLRIPELHRITLEHHTLEGRFLRLRNDPRWPFERLLGGAWLRRFRALTAITPEILEYEVKRSRFTGPARCFPDSIFIDACEKPDGPVWPGGPIKIALLVSRDFPWFGISEKLELFESSDLPVELHVAGHFRPELRHRLESAKRVVLRDHLRIGDLAAFYREMHVGIGSFRLADRMGLRQSTPIKTREYLAHGLPIVYGHEDPGIPEDFPFQLRIPHLDLEAILEFVEKLASTPRVEIREAARPHIDSRIHMRRLYEFCTADGG